MAGIDRRTGKMLQEPERIRQSIQVLLTILQGQITMRREVGFDVLDPKTGKPRVGATADEVTRSARQALETCEPRIAVDGVTPEFRNGVLVELRVSYRSRQGGPACETLIRYGEAA